MVKIKKYIKILGTILNEISVAFEKYFVDENSTDDYKSIKNSYLNKI